MKKFTSVNDVPNLEGLVQKVLAIKQLPYADKSIGQNKTIGLIFLNPSLRTRLSAQKAAFNLGMQTLVVNAGSDAWTWEMQDGAVMNGTTVEHIKDAIQVMDQYCDVLAVRSFAQLQNRTDDYSEAVIHSISKYSSKPLISLESATLHPLQSLADIVTIRENWNESRKPKVLLTWAPHIKPLPQAVANSFAQWMNVSDVDFRIAQPQGFELADEFTGNAKVYYNQEEALQDVDFVYAKNWSSYHDYGSLSSDSNWMLTQKKMELTNNAKFMHCLPVRRNVEVSDAVLDSANSLIYQQANNRTYSAQAVITELLRG